MTTHPSRQALIDDLRQFPSQLAELVAGLTHEQLNTPFLAGEWTVQQNVHHLADSHMNAFIRMKQLLTIETPTVIDYDQDVWATLADYALPISVSLQLLEALHARWVALFERFTDADFARTGTHPATGEISVEGILSAYAEHGKVHLDQIKWTLAAQMT